MIPLKAHVLLEAADDDLALIARLLPDMAGRFLWLSPAAGDAPVPRRPAGVAGGAAECMDWLTKAAMEILELRRGGNYVAYATVGEGSEPEPGFTPHGPLLDRYRGWLGRLGKGLGIDPGPVVRELPAALCFGLGLLCRQNEADNKVSPRTVMAAALWSARRLAREHCRELALYLNAERLNQAVELARRILANLDEKGPLTQRELVRCFNRQRTERFLPVIEAMRKLGAVALRQDGKLESAETDLFDVEDRLRALLAAPAPARGQSARPYTKAVGKPPAKAKGRPQSKPRAAKKAKARRKETEDR